MAFTCHQAFTIFTQILKHPLELLYTSRTNDDKGQMNLAACQNSCRKVDMSSGPSPIAILWPIPGWRLTTRIAIKKPLVAAFAQRKQEIIIFEEVVAFGNDILYPLTMNDQQDLPEKS